MSQKVLVSLPGFHNNLQLNLLIIDLLKEHPEYFYDNIIIDSIYDAFPCKWTAGRGMASWEYELKDKNELKETITPILDRGVQVRYNFTNSLITEKYLNDEKSNQLLEDTLDIVREYNSVLGITVASKPLHDYLKENYKDIYLIWSTTLGRIGLDAINEKTKEDYLVMDFTYNKDFKLINKLENPENIEILANEHCELTCPYRQMHWNWISQVQLAYPNVIEGNTSCMNQERMSQLTKEIDPSIMAEDVNAYDLQIAYMPYGIHRLKLCGRMEFESSLLWDYCRMLVKPYYHSTVQKYLQDNVGYRYMQGESELRYWDERSMILFGRHYNPEEDSGYREYGL